MKIINIINLLLFFCLFSALGSFGDCAEKEKINQKFAEFTLIEINKLRTNPKNYANIIALEDDEKKNAKDKGACNDGGFETYDLLTQAKKAQYGGKKGENIPENILKSYTSTNPIKLNNNLNIVATNYAEYLAENSLFSHTAVLNPSERCKSENYGDCTENIAANTTDKMNAEIENNEERAAKLFVKQLVRDCGVPDRGHLKNLLSPSHKSVGIGFSRNELSEYKNYTAQNFGTK